METIDFNEVIRDPETISVVGGLLPYSQKTDMLKDSYDKGITEGSSLIFLSNAGQIRMDLLFRSLKLYIQGVL